MPNEKQLQFTTTAKSKIAIFLKEHPKYAQEGVEQPSQGATNHVAFLRRNNELCVIKVFCQPERKARECFALQHWQQTGLVPKLLWQNDQDMIINTYLPGVFLTDYEETNKNLLTACYKAGEAFGHLAQTPWTHKNQTVFSDPIYGKRTIDLEQILNDNLQQAKSFSNPKFQDPFWHESLDFVQEHMSAILSQPRFLCHGDAGHILVTPHQTINIFDLEMCFVGNTALQLSYILNSNGLRRLFDADKKRWQAFCSGWEEMTQNHLTETDHQAIIAAHNLRCWHQLLTYSNNPKPKTYRTRIEMAQNIVLS